MNRLLLLLLLILIGCGGGTSGTGGTGSSEIVGKIADTEGNPVAQAQIVVEETGDHTLTNNLGEFDFESNISTDKVTMLITTNNTEARTTVDEIPTGPQIINLDLEVNKRSRTVSVKKKEIKPRPRRPRPTPTSAPTASATVAPTVIPTAEPTVSATVTVEVSPSPTPNTELFTNFIGQLVTNDSTLLSDAKIGIVGKGRRIVNADGTFRFRIKAASENNHLVVASSGKLARIKIDGINEKTKRAKLQLRLEKRSDLSLTLALEVAEITQH